MKLETLKEVRNLLLKVFLVSLIFAWLMAAATVGLWDYWSSIMSQMLRTPHEALGPMISNWFALIKFYMVFLLLAPALGLHWEIKSREKKCPE